MKNGQRLISWVLWTLGILMFGNLAAQDYRISPIPFSNVTLQDDFWAPKIRTNHEVTIPIAYQQSDKTGRIDNFKIAGGLMEGQFCTEYPFDDTDIYKIIEAASYSIQTFPDPDMELMMDSLIQLIALAQEPDGYLYTTRTIGANVHPWAGENRWELVHELSHELYNLGHLYEAAVAHYQATGKESLLNIAIKSADLVLAEFGHHKLQNVPGHQEIEIGLIKLYRATQDDRYLDLAKYFLDIRGQQGIGNPKEYDQSHLPVVKQKEAVGHAVRGAYMWAAMADIAAITKDSAYLEAINYIWHDIVDKKYYLNGGIGATGSGEAFGHPYELPNMTAYCETCAGVGNAIWNHRMFLMTGDSKFIDVLERTMYNNILDGVSLSGDRFFYPNPLASYGQHERSAWFGCACCPPNVARFLPSMPGYIYAQEEEIIYVNLYVSSTSEFNINGDQMTLSMQSEFPWEGNVSIRTVVNRPLQARLKLRIPGYVKNQPVPSNLYRYELKASPEYAILVNNETIAVEEDSLGYVVLDRVWKNGDEITIAFPFEVQKVFAHPEVKVNRDKFAVERGPLLYCAEWPDNPDGKVLNLIVDPNKAITEDRSELLGGMVTLHGSAKQAARQLDGSIQVTSNQALTLIPYFLWNNRGPGQMTVWLPTTKVSTLPDPAPTIARLSSITSSSDRKRGEIALNDQLYPTHSNDHSVSYLHWWPKQGTREWIQLDFKEQSTIQQVKLYWFDDGPYGGCRVPKNWSVEYLEAGQWKMVEAQTPYSITKNAWDSVSFSPVQAQAIKIWIDLPDEYATGLYEVIVE